MGADEVDLGRLDLGAPARVRLPRGEPMRLSFLGVEGTPDPSFGDDLLGFTVEGREVRHTAAVRNLWLGGTEADPEGSRWLPARSGARDARRSVFS